MTDKADLEIDGLMAARLILAFRVTAAATLIAGVIAALKLGVPYWVDRSGKVIVIISLLTTYIQFRLEEHHEKNFLTLLHRTKAMIASRGMSTWQADEAIRSIVGEAKTGYETIRRRVFKNAIGIAILGEFVAAFGGVILSGLATLLEVPVGGQH